MNCPGVRDGGLGDKIVGEREEIPRELVIWNTSWPSGLREGDDLEAFSFLV